MPPLFVSYYTLNTGYEQEIKNLTLSSKKLSLETDFVAIESKGSWEQNCCYKPQFLLEMLEKHKRPIVWIDADAVILKKPLFFDSLECDIALRIYEDLPLEHPSKVNTATVYLRNTKQVKELLKLWKARCHYILANKIGEPWDQSALRDVLFQQESPISVKPLPDSYCTIYDKKITPLEDAVILQYQASRTLKHEESAKNTPKLNSLINEERTSRFFHRLNTLYKSGNS